METKTSIIIEAIDKASAQIKGVQNSISGMSTSATTAGKSFDTLTSKAEAASSKFKSIGDRFQQLNSTMTQFAVAGGLAIAGLTAIISKYKTFAESMATVQMRTNATNSEMKKTQELLGQIDTFKGWEEMGSGLASLTADIGDLNKSLEMLPNVTNLATAAMTDISSTASIVTRAIAAFGLTLKDTANMTDVLAIAANKPQLSLAELGSALQQIGPTASAVGIQFEDLISVFVALAGKGQAASQSAASLRMIFQTLLDPSTEVKNYMQELGISLDKVRDSTGGISFSSLVQEFESAGVGAEQLAKMFGSREFGTFAVLMEAGSSELKKLDVEFSNASGSAEKLAKVVNDSDFGEIEKLQKALQQIAIEFGPLAIDSMKGLTAAFKPMIELLSDLNKATDGVAMKVLTVVGAVGLLAKGATSLVSIGIKLAPVLTTIGIALTAIPLSAAAALGSSAVAFTGIGVGATGAAAAVGTLAAGFGLLGIAIAAVGATAIGVIKVIEAFNAMAEAGAAKKMADDYTNVTSKLMALEEQAKGASGYIGLIAKEMQKADESLTRNRAIDKILSGDVPTEIMIKLGLNDTEFSTELYKFVNSPAEYVKGVKVDLTGELKKFKNEIEGTPPAVIDKLVVISGSPEEQLKQFEDFRAALGEKLNSINEIAKDFNLSINLDEQTKLEYSKILAKEDLINKLKEIAEVIRSAGSEIPAEINDMANSVDPERWTAFLDEINTKVSQKLGNTVAIATKRLGDLSKLLQDNFHVSVNEIEGLEKLESQLEKKLDVKNIEAQLLEIAKIFVDAGEQIPALIGDLGQKIKLDNWKQKLSELTTVTNEQMVILKKTVSDNLSDLSGLIQGMKINLPELNNGRGTLSDQLQGILAVDKTQAQLQTWVALFEEHGAKIPKALNDAIEQINLKKWVEAVKSLESLEAQMAGLKPVVFDSLIEIKSTGLEKFEIFKKDLQNKLQEINKVAGAFELSLDLDENIKIDYSKAFAKDELISKLEDITRTLYDKGLEIPKAINAMGNKIDPEQWRTFLTQLTDTTSDVMAEIKGTVNKGISDVTDIFSSLNIDISGLGDLSGLEQQIMESLKMDKLESTLETWARTFKERGEEIPKELVAMAQKINFDVLAETTSKAVANTSVQLNRLKTDIRGTVNSLQPTLSSIPQLNVIGSKIQQIRVEFFMKLNSEEFLKDWGKLGWSMQNNLKNVLQYGV